MTAASLRNDLQKLGFCEAIFGRRRLYLAPGIAAHAAACGCYLVPIGNSAVWGVGTRGGTLGVAIAGLPPMFARRCRRGGLMRFMVSEIYAGLAPRPLCELVVTA